MSQAPLRLFRSPSTRPSENRHTRSPYCVPTSCGKESKKTCTPHHDILRQLTCATSCSPQDSPFYCTDVVFMVLSANSQVYLQQSYVHQQTRQKTNRSNIRDCSA